MYSVVISLSCGISLNVLIALLKMSLFNNNTWYLEHAGARFWRYAIWWADSVECMLPRALVLLSLHFLTCTCVYVMHGCVQNTWGHFRSDKRPDTMLSDRKRKFNFRCSCMNRFISVKRRRHSLSPPPFLPFLSPSVTLVDSLWLY